MIVQKNIATWPTIKKIDIAIMDSELNYRKNASNLKKTDIII